MIYHLIWHEILDRTVYFVCHFNVYFSCKWRKCSQNSEKCKFMRPMIYHLVRHKILCKMVYSALLFSDIEIFTKLYEKIKYHPMI